MAVDSSSFIAGHYHATFNAQDIGTTEQGFVLRPVYYREDIRIDEYGDTVVDGIFRGFSIGVSCQLSEWTATGRAGIQFPFGSVGQIDNVGKTIIGAGYAKPLVLTPGNVAGYTLNSTGTATDTFTVSYTAPDGQHGGWNLNTKLRRVDINLVAFPRRADGVVFGIA